MKQTRRAMAASIAVALWFGLLGTHLLAPTWAQDAPADDTEQPSEEELTRQYGRLPQDRFYRHASHLYDQTVRFAQADPDKLSPQDQFLRAYYEGRWDEVRRQLDMLPADLARQIYDKMLKDLNDRYTPILTLDDFFGLANAAPAGLDTTRIRQLGLLLRVAVAREQAAWLKRALEQDSRYLGPGPQNRLTTGRVLIHAEFDELARQFLPSAVEATQLEDSTARQEIQDFWTSQGQLEEYQQTRVAELWEERAVVLGNENASSTDRRRAADRLAELMNQAPANMIEPWLADLMRVRLDGALELVAVFGRNAQNLLGNADTKRRANVLQIQKMVLRLASERTDLAQPPWQAIAMGMADWWIREAEYTFEHAPSYRSTERPRPYVDSAELLDSVPEGTWRAMLPPAYQERIDVCLSKAVLVSDRYEAAVQLIADLADRNLDAGRALAEEYLKAWAHRHNPQVPEKIRRALKLPDEARIVVTPLMMQKNIDDLAAMLQLFRSRKVLPRNTEVLVEAFDICYSNAEVYRRGHIEKVFGTIEEMDEPILYHMLTSMTKGLASRWQNLEVQEDEGTRRTEAETLAMVRDGYQTALDIIDARVQVQPAAWRLLSLGGSLYSGWGDFEYYQQLVSETSTHRLEAYQDKNHRATDYFRRAAVAYGQQVPNMRPGDYSIEAYLNWFHALLGLGANGQLNVSKPLDRVALSEIRDLVRGLPDPAAQNHIDKIARHVAARLEDVEHPIHEDLKYKYLAGSLVITRESPFSFQTAEKVEYFDELLDELRLETRVDGPNTISRDHDFGIILSVQHTEAMGRMADFGKYLVNEVVATHAPSRQGQQDPVTVYRLGDIQGNRDILEMNIRESLSLFFDIRSISFSPRDVMPRATPQPGWQETVLAYVLCRPKDASVDKIPRIQMELEFLDLTGPVRISAESPETMIKVTDQPTPPRPFDKVDMQMVVDARQLSENQEVLLEISATGNGLLPELDQLIDVNAIGNQLPIVQVDTHDGANLKQVASWAQQVHAITDRRWTVVLDGSSLVDPPGSLKLALPTLLVDNGSLTCQTYQDLDLVDLTESSVVLGAGEPTAEDSSDSTAWTWQPYALAGGGAAGVAALALLLWQATRRRERPLRARDVFHLPARIDGFTVVRLLRALQTSPLVQLDDVRRQELQQDIQRVQTSCFDHSTAALTETELRDLARRWLKTAC